MMSPVTIYHYLATVPSGVFLFLARTTQASCTRPVLGSNTYTLTDEMTVYSLNSTYEIFCVPGYIISGDTSIVCLESGKWSAGSPTCTAAEGTYPWWMLLVGVMLIVLLLACILPRFLSCVLKKKKREGPDTDETERQQMNDPFKYFDDDVR